MKLTRIITATFAAAAGIALFTACGTTPASPVPSTPAAVSAPSATASEQRHFPYPVTQGTSTNAVLITSVINNLTDNHSRGPDNTETRNPSYVACEDNTELGSDNEYEFNCNIQLANGTCQSYWVSLTTSLDDYYITKRSH